MSQDRSESDWVKMCRLEGAIVIGNGTMDLKIFAIRKALITMCLIRLCNY